MLIRPVAGSRLVCVMQSAESTAPGLFNRPQKIVGSMPFSIGDITNLMVFRQSPPLSGGMIPDVWI